ncbi:MAG: 4Fe-4S binding protein [bacterium]|nr:4Fe-4S binding protein [bacterium]
MNPEEPIHKKPGTSKAALATTLATGAVAVAVAGAMVMGILERLTPTPPVQVEVLRSALPDGARFQDRSDPLPHFPGIDGNGEKIGAVILTDELAPSVQGYLGQVGTAVGLTPDGRIAAVRPFRHKETPYYMEMVITSGLLDEIAGIDMAKPFPDLDAVSGATITSRALIEDVRLSAARAAQALYSIQVPEPEARQRGPVPFWKESLLAVTLLLSFTAGFLGNGWFKRYGMGLLTLAVVGLILNTPLTLSAISRILQTNLPGTGNWALLLLVLYILISSPFQGRAYCRHVCPFGTLQVLLHRLSPMQVRVPSGVNVWLPAIKRAFAALLICIGIWGGMGGFTEIEPFFSLFSFNLTPLLWMMVIFVLAVSIFWRRFWCNTLCPTGTLLALYCRATRHGKGKRDETIQESAEEI